MPVAMEAYVSSVRELTAKARQAELAQIYLLRPRLCRQAAPLLLHWIGWLMWTVAAPTALLVIARDHPSEAYATGFEALSYAMLATGAAYLATVLWPVLRRGILFKPKAPALPDPFIREEQQLQGDEASPRQAASSGVLLRPQEENRHVELKGRCVHVLYNCHGAHGEEARQKGDLCIRSLCEKRAHVSSRK